MVAGNIKRPKSTKRNILAQSRGLIKRQLLLERHHSRIDTQKGENLVA